MEQNEVYKAFYNFIVVMKEKLDKNSNKGGWREMESSWLFMRLQGEIGELYAEMMAKEVDPHKVARECADVANFAMMIADKVEYDKKLQVQVERGDIGEDDGGSD